MRALKGYVDAEGRLVAADPRLLDLQLAAGGEEGGPVAIPQLISLARIARSLGIPIARPVIIADGERAVEVLARAKLMDGVVHLALSDLDAATPVGLEIPEDDAAREAEFANLEREARWECDEKLTFLKVAETAALLLGVNLTDPETRPFGEVFVPVPGPKGQMPILEALVQRTGFSGQRVQLADHPEILAFVEGEPIFTKIGDFKGYRGFVRPLETENDPHSARGAAISDVAQRLDGALRKPIGRIIDNADVLHAADEGDLHPQYQDYAADIGAAGRHLLGLVDDLVDLQAIERSDFKVEDDAIDLADIARRAAGLLAVRAADQQVRIDKPDEDERLPARGEFRRVLQILVNLIGNAVRYSPEKGMVWIRTESEGDIAVVVVADQGKGIAHEDQDRIFEKFERVDPSEPGGSGLGLYIARRLARAMGGDITIDSAPGLGARFALSLPADRLA